MPPVVHDDEPRGRAPGGQTRHACFHPRGSDAVVERVPGAPPEHLRGGRRPLVYAQAEGAHARGRGRHDRLRGFERGRRDGDARHGIGATRSRRDVVGLGHQAQRAFRSFACEDAIARLGRSAPLLDGRLGVQRVAAERRAEAVRGDERENGDVRGFGRSFLLLPRRRLDRRLTLAAPHLQKQELRLRGMESHSLAPHVGVIHHSLHRALAMNRLVVGRREAICTTWREMGSARCAPEGPTAFSPRLSTPTCTGSKSRTSSPVHSERTRSSRTVSSSNLGETPSKIARLPTRSTPSCNNNPAIAAPLPLASRFPPRAIAPAGLDRCARSKASDGFTPAPRERENGLSADAPRRNDPSLGTSDRPKISHLSSQSCSPVQSASNETDFAHRSRTDVSRSFSSLTVFLRSPRAR